MTATTETARSESCPICAGASRIVAVHRSSVTSGSRLLEAPSTLHACGSCGHAFTTAAVDWSAYYRSEYDSVLTDGGMDEMVSGPDGSVAFRTDVDYAMFRRMVGDRVKSDAPIVEIGCGRGRIVSRLTRDGFTNIDAFDVSELYRAPLSAIIAPERVHIGDKPRGSWDLALSFFVLEHDSDPVASLTWMRKSLCVGGYLYLMVPNPTTNLGDFACADHAHHYFPEVLSSLVEACGFTNVTIDTSSVGATALTAQAAFDPHPMAENLAHVSRTRRGLAPYCDFKERLDRLAGRVDRDKPLYLYGAGFYAATAAAELRRAGLRVAGVFDANPHKHGLERLGSVVADPAIIPEGCFDDATLLVCVNERAFPAVANAWAKHFSACVPL